MPEYIEFILRMSTGKTKIYHILSIKNKMTLGSIHWYSAWRQYCFFPSSDTIWNSDCLQKVTDFLKVLNEEHRKPKDKSILDRIEDASAKVGDKIGDAIDKVL